MTNISWKSLYHWKTVNWVFFISAYHHITSITIKTIKEGEGVIISCFILVCSQNYVRCIATEVNWKSLHFSCMYLLQLISSRVSCQGHMIVELQFFETVARYEKFFLAEPQHIPDVLVCLILFLTFCWYFN